MRKLMYILMACFMAFGIVSCSDSGSDEPNIVATPTATLDPVDTDGDIISPTTVTLATATSGATIWYTITEDGDPSDSENPDRIEYTAPFQIGGAVNGEITIRAIAERAGWTTSELFEDIYIVTARETALTPTSTPTAAFGPREIESTTPIMLVETGDNAKIYYTYDLLAGENADDSLDTDNLADNPVDGWVEYDGANLNQSPALNIDVWAIAAYDDFMERSDVLAAQYTLVATPNTVAKPYALIETQDGVPPTATIASGTAIMLETSTAGAEIYYTTDGAIPNADSISYDSTTGINTAEIAEDIFTLYAIAIDPSTTTPMTSSSILSIAFTIADTE